MTTTQITVIEETIYTDGSGSCGLYEVYGQRFSGITTGLGGVVTVTPVAIRSGFRGGREKWMVRQGAKAIEIRLASMV